MEKTKSISLKDDKVINSLNFKIISLNTRLIISTERNEVHILIGTRGSEIIECKGNISKVYVRGHSKEELKS